MKREIFGTREWAENSFNCCNGCMNNCRYCYAKKMAVRYGRKKNTNEWITEEIKEKRTPTLSGRVMIPTTHDLTSGTVREVSMHIVEFLKKGNDLLIVSKPRIECIKYLISEIENNNFLYDAKDQIMFRFSIGSTCDEVLSYWEPEAPLFSERIEALKYVHYLGYKTSVSSEPMLSLDQETLYQEIKNYITDSIWFGKLNNHNISEENRYFAEMIRVNTSDQYVMALYERFKGNDLVKWKESIKKVVGLKVSTEKGLDI